MGKKAQCGFVFSAAFAALMTGAQAADIPVKRSVPAAAPVAIAAYDWTGFYLGLHAGGGWALSHWFDVSPPRPDRDEGEGTAEGWIAGGQAGYNFQTGALVLGVDVQGSFAELSGSRRNAFFTGLQNHTDVNSLVTVAGRLGVAQNNLLWFAKAGAAWGDSDFLVTTASGGRFASWSQSRTGWMAGGGAEWGLTPNCSFKIEYNYIDFGSETTNAIGCGSGCGFSEQVDQRVHTVMGGFNYRFPVR